MTMLQFSGTLFNLPIRQTPRVPLWFTTQQLIAANSSFSNPKLDINSNQSPATEKVASNQKNVNVKSTLSSRKIDIRDLFENSRNRIVENVLSSVTPGNMSPEYSLQIISKLSELVNKNTIKMSDFQYDIRYKAVCSQIAKRPQLKSVSTIVALKEEIEKSRKEMKPQNLGLFFDMSEIQKIVDKPNMSGYEAVQIMSKLAFHKSRVVPVLQSLTNHIVNNNETMNIKQESNILYYMSTLNFYNEVLVDKIASDLVLQIPTIEAKYSAVMGSILKSLGLLRYRNEKLLMEFTTWILANSKDTRPQDLCSFFVTSAILGFNPFTNLEAFENVSQNLEEADMADPYAWLDVVWALTVLNQASESQILSVLNQDFINKLSDLSPLCEPKKRKLLNLKAAMSLIFKKDTNQIFNQNPSISEITLERCKEKQEFVNSILAALYAYLPSNGCLKTNINTEMGFPLDAEFYVDKNCNPVPIKQNQSKQTQVFRLGIEAQSYYDFCRGDEKVIGPILFQRELLKLSGYHVIPISYKEFQLHTKVVERVKYLKDKSKTAVEALSV